MTTLSNTQQPHNNAAMNIKQQLRETSLKRRAALTEEMHRNKSREICARAMSHLPLQYGDVIAGFWPMRNEPDIRMLLESLHESGYHVALPFISNQENPMKFKHWQPGDALIPHSKYGVMQPKEVANNLTPDIIFAPLLAFDKDGYRLGYGGGFYDRAIAELLYAPESSNKLLIAGICFDEEQVIQLPHEKHDQIMDCAITDKRVVLFD